MSKALVEALGNKKQRVRKETKAFLGDWDILVFKGLIMHKRRLNTCLVFHRPNFLKVFWLPLKFGKVGKLSWVLPMFSFFTLDTISCLPNSHSHMLIFPPLLIKCWFSSSLHSLPCDHMLQGKGVPIPTPF